MPIFNLRKRIFFPVVLSLFIRPCVATESSKFAGGSVTQDRNSTTKRDGSQKAISSKEQGIPEKSANWITHATLSYQQWQQGNIFTAIREGEEAIKLNPNSSTSLINLALMNQRTSNYAEAISLYWRAANLLPDSWVPPLGIARCYILSNDLSNGRETLHMMSEQNDRNFDWYYMTARTWLEIDDLSMADKTASLAISVANKPEQRSAAENLQFLALLRAGKIERAKSLQDNVLHNNSLRDPEIFVRSAATLLPVDNPAAGKDLLNCAIRNLTNVADADAFLKLGRIFQGKAGDNNCDQAHRALWLENAQTAYVRALATKADSADYHFALAGVYSSQGQPLKAAEELRKFSSFDHTDILAPFLVSKILASGALVNDTFPVSLSLIKFKINGLNCSCHLAKIHGALRKTKGVAFISTPPQRPYSGLVLIDQSLTPAREMLAQCSNNALPPELDSKGHPTNIKLEITSEEPVNSVNDALKIAQEIRFGSVVSFQKTYSDYLNRFQEVSPIMPLYNHSTVNGAETASSWNVPL